MFLQQLLLSILSLQVAVQAEAVKVQHLVLVEVLVVIGHLFQENHRVVVVLQNHHWYWN
jgi:hypothetical protein